MNIAKRYLDLCLFRIGPADMPVSGGLLQLTLLAYFGIGIAISHIDNTWMPSVISSLADTLFMVIAIRLMLNFKQLQARFQQTLTALAGAGAVLGLISLPIMRWFYHMDEALRASSFAMLLVIVLTFWSLMITAHIFRHALDIKSNTAAMLTIIYTVLSLIILGLTLSGVA